MTYRMWYTENSIPLAELAIEWKATEGDVRFAFLGMAWTPAVFQNECNLSNDAITMYRNKLNKVTATQFAAYYLAVGPSLFAKGMSPSVAFHSMASSARGMLFCVYHMRYVMSLRFNAFFSLMAREQRMWTVAGGMVA